MTPILRELEQRRAALVVRSGVQRACIAARLAPAARGLAATDRFAAALRAHPVMTGMAASVLALIGPRTLLRWAMRLVPVYALLTRR